MIRIEFSVPISPSTEISGLEIKGEPIVLEQVYNAIKEYIEKQLKEKHFDLSYGILGRLCREMEKYFASVELVQKGIEDETEH